jgi:hypothetical protein
LKERKENRCAETRQSHEKVTSLLLLRLAEGPAEAPETVQNFS